MRTWGEAGVVKIKSSTSPKFKEKDVTCLFSRHAEDYDGECYRMWDTTCDYVYFTRDVVCLKRIYFSHNKCDRMFSSAIFCS